MTTSSRRLLTAELLSIGSELTVGETRDTNASELARSLTALGVRVRRLTALPDDLATVTEAFQASLARADLVVSTGGLGPTPDDLTREAVAAACGEEVVVDPATEAWLRELWRRRGVPFPEVNRKQAWVIPSAEALPNPNGTAPGWYVRRPDGRRIVVLPGPPREMRPMWADEALPRLAADGIGADVATRTYRLTGIGESQVAELLGDDILRAANPVVATYARAEAVDVRISASAEPGRLAEELVAEAAERVLAALGDHVWATGETTWSQAVGDRLATAGWSLAVIEVATGGSVAALLGDAPWLRFDEIVADDLSEAAGTRVEGDPGDRVPGGAEDRDPLIGLARRARDLGGADVGIAVRARPRGDDTVASIAVVAPTGERHVRRLVFLSGPAGRARAAIAAAAVLLETLPVDELA